MRQGRSVYRHVDARRLPKTPNPNDGPALEASALPRPTAPPARTIRGRSPPIWYPHLVPAAPGLRLGTGRSRQKPRQSGAFVQAAEGTRTLDLLHGKQTV